MTGPRDQRQREAQQRLRLGGTGLALTFLLYIAAGVGRAWMEGRL